MTRATKVDRSLQGGSDAYLDHSDPSLFYAGATQVYPISLTYPIDESPYRHTAPFVRRYTGAKESRALDRLDKCLGNIDWQDVLTTEAELLACAYDLDLCSPKEPDPEAQSVINGFASLTNRVFNLEPNEVTRNPWSLLCASLEGWRAKSRPGQRSQDVPVLFGGVEMPWYDAYCEATKLHRARDKKWAGARCLDTSRCPYVADFEAMPMNELKQLIALDASRDNKRAWALCILRERIFDGFDKQFRCKSDVRAARKADRRNEYLKVYLGMVTKCRRPLSSAERSIPVHLRRPLLPRYS